MEESSLHIYAKLPTRSRRFARRIAYAVFNTYNSCYRVSVFHITKATLVSQSYHLPRPVMTCQGLGIDAVGVAPSTRAVILRPATSCANGSPRTKRCYSWRSSRNQQHSRSKKIRKGIE